MAYLPEHPTLTDLQHYLDEVCKERGWVKDTYAEKFLLFTEEVGELAKAIRKTAGLYDEKAKQKNIELEEEFADVLSYLLDLANYFQIDLGKLFVRRSRLMRVECGSNRRERSGCCSISTIPWVD